MILSLDSRNSPHYYLTLRQNGSGRGAPLAQGERKPEGNRADPADVHGADDRHFRDGGQRRSHVCRQTDRAERAGRLKQGVHAVRRRVRRHDDAGGHDDDQHADGQNGKGAVNRKLVQPALEHDGVVAAAHDAGHRGHQHDKGRRFDSAAGRGGGCADEHEKYHDQLGQVALGGRVDRIKASRARRDGLEKSRVQLLAKVHMIQRIVIFTD